MNRNILARNIRHRLADMFGSKWNGALDAAMDEMLLEEIDKFDIISVLPAAKIPTKEEPEGPVHEDDNDGTTAWPLRKRDEAGDPYLKGIMDKD